MSRAEPPAGGRMAQAQTGCWRYVVVFLAGALIGSSFTYAFLQGPACLDERSSGLALPPANGPELAPSLLQSAPPASSVAEFVPSPSVEAVSPPSASTSTAPQAHSSLPPHASPSNDASRPAQPVFLFVAGLESSGHHMMGKLLSDCISKVGDCVWDKDVFRGVFPALFSGSIERDAARLAGVLRSAAQKYRTKRVVVLNTISHGGGRVPDMMAYPDIGGGGRTPNVLVLDRAADEAGVELRVLVLVRAFSAVLQSITRRGFVRSPQAGTQRLSKNGNELLRQLHGLHTHHVHCLLYEEARRAGSNVSAFLGVDLQKFAAQAFQPHGSVHRSSNAQEPLAKLEGDLRGFCTSKMP